MQYEGAWVASRHACIASEEPAKASWMPSLHRLDPPERPADHSGEHKRPVAIAHARGARVDHGDRHGGPHLRRPHAGELAAQCGCRRQLAQGEPCCSRSWGLRPAALEATCVSTHLSAPPRECPVTRMCSGVRPPLSRSSTDVMLLSSAAAGQVQGRHGCTAEGTAAAAACKSRLQSLTGLQSNRERLPPDSGCVVKDSNCSRKPLCTCNGAGGRCESGARHPHPGSLRSSCIAGPPSLQESAR